MSANKEKNNNQVVYPSDFSYFTPNKVEMEVKRDSMLNTIDLYFDNGDKVILVCGVEGMGKTVLLSQFLERHRENCIAIFIDVINKQSYSEDNIIRDLYRQVSFAINGVEPKDTENADIKALTKQMYLLDTSLRKEKKKMFILIDGLCEIPKDDHYIVIDILDLMPFTAKNISFIFASSNNVIEKHLSKQSSHSIEMLLFSEPETMEVLPGVDISIIRNILAVFRGVPESLYVIKRLIDGGMPAEEILQNYSANGANTDLFKAEWERSIEEVSKYKDFLGLLSFSIRPLKISQIACILKVSNQEVLRVISEIGFIEESSESAKFLSNGLKLYAKEQLEDIEASSLKSIVSNFSNSPKDKDTLSEINSYYDRLGNYPEIIDQLSNNNIALLFRETKSINEAVKQIKLGGNAAKKVSSETDLLRFSHARSIMSVLGTSNILGSELLCYLTEEDYESALGLVSSSKVLEERFHLLATISSFQKKKKDAVDEDVERRITEDFSRIDPENLGVEKTTELAAELFPAFPEMSLSLINQMDSLEQGGGNKAEYAFFRLSVEALKKGQDSVDTLLSSLDTVEDKKKEALSMLGLFKKGTPAEKIISKLGNFKEPGDAIFILKNWISTFPEDEGAPKLVNELLSLIVSTTNYHANASLYADILTSIQFMPKDKGLELLEKITPKFDYLKKTGPTLDFVRLQANVAIFEKNNGIYTDREQELVKYILEEIDDASIKLSALSLMSVLAFKNENFVLVCDFDKEKEKAFTSLVNSTADHVMMIKDALIREVEFSLSNSLKWASRLNTRPRRDYAYALVAKKSCQIKCVESIDKVCSIIRKIKNKDYKNEAIVALFEYCLKLETISKSDLKRLIKLRNKVRNNFLLCNINTSLLLLISKVNLNCSEQEANIIEATEISWAGIDGDWYKIDAAYKIHNRLIESNKDVANNYKEKAISLRLNNAENSREIADSQVFSVDLAIRSFYFLCLHSVNTEHDFNQLINIVCSISGAVPRIKQFSRLASVLHLTGKIDLFENILENHLTPNLDTLGEEYCREVSVGLYWAAPMIFIYSRDMFERKLLVVSDDVSIFDDILNQVQGYMLNKCILGDPFDPVQNHKYKITSKEIEDHLYLVRNMKEDSRIYFGLNKIIKIIVRGNKSNTYSIPQLTLIDSEVGKIIESKFDSDEYIKHIGYKLCCKILLLSLNGNKSEQDWKRLVDEVDSISIDSDKVYVLGEIIEYLPANLLTLKKQLLRRAVDLTDSLPSRLERIARYESLSKIGQTFDLVFVKEFVRRAVLLSTSEDTEAYEEKRLSLIDSIYTMDRDFAIGLSALVDDDPARKKIIENNISKKNSEKKERDDFDVSSNDIKKNALSEKYPKLMWSLLGKLNASNHLPDKRADYLNFLDSISSYDFVNVYPMLSYYIHSQGVFASNKKQASSKMRPIFEVLSNGALLFSELCELNQKTSESIGSNGEQIVFGTTEGEKATEFVNEWVSILDAEANELIIIDPYFTHEDLEFIGDVTNKDPNFRIRILTSYSNLKLIAPTAEPSASDVMRAFWRANVSSDAMPYIDVVFCGIPSLNNEMPIHDRWWISGKTGLRLGGSINGIEGKRITSISKMKNEEVIPVSSRIDGYLYRTQRLYQDERINYLEVSM
jgi:hypothetical protein